MNDRFKRLLCLILSVWMLLTTAFLVACADEKEPISDDPQDPTSENEEITPPAQEEQRLPIDYLPEETYGGTEIHVLEWFVNETPNNRIPWEEIDVDTLTGNTLEDAVFKRNSLVEEKFEVLITKEYVEIYGTPTYVNTLRANEQSGEERFQMITVISESIATICQEGMMTNMYELGNLHTDMPWWNQDSVRAYTMGNSLYFASPELLLRDKGATAAIFYNKAVAESHGITGLYNLVEAGEWTWEEMISMCEDVTADVDGDDKVSSAEDMYGLTGHMRCVPYYLFAGADLKFASINEDGYLELQFGSDERCITTYQEMVDEVLFSDYYFQNLQDPSKIPTGFAPFEADKALFLSDMVKMMVLLRNMTTDYGILPVPKYDKSQEDYSSLVFWHHDSVLGIPASVTNTDAVSTVLEYMSYLSYYDIYPIFYETVLKDRSTRDEQSVEMLEIIFRTRTFDPGHYWLTTQIHTMKTFLNVFENKTRDIASFWASLESRAETAVEDFNKRIDEMH